MRWDFIKKFPKFVFVFGLLAVSTGLFGFWWMQHQAKLAWANHPSAIVEDIRPKLALIESKPTRLLLVDKDLYDLDSGAVIFKSWLKEGPPAALYYDSKAKKFIGRYERGFVRYALDGKEEATLGQRFPPAFSTDFKWALYVKGKDIYRADVDWSEFKFQNEKKLTAIEQFNEQGFAANIVLGTDKTLIVRNMPQLLRVNLDTGEVHPNKMPMLEIGKRRSPDSKSVVGVQNGQFYCYDVDSDETKTIPVGRNGAMNDYQWLNDNKCVGIAAGKTVVIYDRVQNTLNEVVALPVQCTKIAEPSPDGRFVFCYSWKGGVLVDLEKKAVLPVKGGAGISWVSSDTFAVSREVPDSELRGTWLQTAGESERRVLPEPYLVGKAAGFVLPLPSVGIVVFATKQGLSKMKEDGTDLMDLVKLNHPPGRALGIKTWMAP